MAANLDYPGVEQPTGDPMLWRYMDFAKFVSLIDSSALHLSRADRLGDPFEGSYSRVNVKLRPEVYREIPEGSEVLAAMSRFHEWVRQWTYVSCWHMNEQESAAMWSLYAASNQAVAVTCKYSSLAACLPDDSYLGLVQYMDYESEWVPEGSVLYSFLHKRKSFSHEREVRAVQQDVPSLDGKVDWSRVNEESGRLVKVSLDDLIESVYVAPTCPSWLPDLTRNICRRYDYDIPVVMSALDSEPIY